MSMGSFGCQRSLPALCFSFDPIWLDLVPTRRLKPGDKRGGARLRSRQAGVRARSHFAETNEDQWPRWASLVWGLRLVHFVAERLNILAAPFYNYAVHLVFCCLFGIVLPAEVPTTCSKTGNI